MKSEAWGWLAAGVLALGLNGIYHDGGAAWLHRNVGRAVARVADKSGAVLALATGRADLFLAKAEVPEGRDETAACRMAAAMAHMRGKLQRSHDDFEVEESSAREEAAIARWEASRARMEAKIARAGFSLVSFDGVKVSYPHMRVRVPRVSFPGVEIPEVNVETPEVHVDVMGSDPI